MKILVLAEKDQALAGLCSGARILGDRVEMVAIGEVQKSVPGADKIWFIPAQDTDMVEDFTETIAALIQKEQPELVLVAPTKRFKLIAGRLAAILGSSVITDAIEISPDGTAKHMVYGGAAIRSEKGSKTTSIVTVGASVLKGNEVAAGSTEVETVEFVPPRVKMKRVGRQVREKISVNLPGAKRVIGVGRGIGKEEDLAMIGELAQAIGGEVGCTRPIAEEEHWMPRELYIGISGLMLAPEVYIAVGISGQVQHTVGIDRSKVVIAINDDKGAPIFKQSDYGIVGDLYKVVPALIAALK